MNILLKCSLMLILILTVSCANIVNPEEKVVFKQQEEIYKLIYKVGNIYSYGTCFLIDYQSKTYLISAYHVIKDSKNGEIILKDKNDNIIKDIILGSKQYSDEYDVVIFNVDKLLNEHYIYKTKKSNDIILKGFPEGKQYKQSNGDIEIYETNGEIIEGMSGGVVVDNEGYAIGVITARYANKKGGLFVDLNSSLENILDKNKK